MYVYQYYVYMYSVNTQNMYRIYGHMYTYSITQNNFIYTLQYYQLDLISIVCCTCMSSTLLCGFLSPIYVAMEEEVLHTVSKR